MCGTSGGAVPLGMYMTNEMTISSMTQVFIALRSMIGNGAFNNRGNSGPISVMSDDGVEVKAFQDIYPDTRRRRCCFHILQNGK